MVLAIETTGLHPSTEACLEMMQILQARAEPRNILDLGCGNGILAVAAAHIWDASVLAADISENAVAETTKRVTESGLLDRISIIRSDGFSNPVIAQNGPYDLILANLLAKTLFSVSGDVKKHLSSDGYCIISGVLTWLGPELEAGFAELGLETIDKKEKSPWLAYLLCHGNET